jgi:hypothetical protein
VLFRSPILSPFFWRKGGAPQTSNPKGTKSRGQRPRACHQIPSGQRLGNLMSGPSVLNLNFISKYAAILSGDWRPAQFFGPHGHSEFARSSILREARGQRLSYDGSTERIGNPATTAARPSRHSYTQASNLLSFAASIQALRVFVLLMRFPLRASTR